jgi:hypothetical protein
MLRIEKGKKEYKIYMLDELTQCEHDLGQPHISLLCIQKRPNGQSKLPTNTLHAFSLHVSNIITKRSIRFFQGLQTVISYVQQDMRMQQTYPTLGLWKEEHYKAS